MTQRLVLDEIVNPYGARVLVERGADQRVRSARFDMGGLPRVESLLIGRPVDEIPALVERLCGVCPAAHHLAGVRALEALGGPVELSPAAVIARRLLHHASALATHAMRFVATDRETAIVWRRLAKAVMVAVGSPGHFPSTAVPGGIAGRVAASDLESVRVLLPEVLEGAPQLARRQIAGAPGSGPGRFSGADVALVDAQGRPDLLGTRLRAVGSDGGILIDAAKPSRWTDLVEEQRPGQPAPRPHLVVAGTGRGSYRVGPVAQLRVGALGTPIAAGLQRDWLRAGAGALAARAVMAVHSAEAIAELIERPELLGRRLTVPVGPVAGGPREGVGWVDGPRGLLVHRYGVGPDGLLVDAQILTPTAQNEPWLAELLTAVARRLDGAGEQEGLAMEESIRETDPCLPCAMAPPGAMGLAIEEIRAGDDNVEVDSATRRR